jgi:Radical SAM superfamily
LNARIAELKSKQQYASLLMTYCCTIACEHCCFGCSPRKPQVVVEVDDAVRYLGELHKLDRMVHIAGGEAFMFYERLRDILRAAHDAGVAPHFVETNCSWCTSDDETRERLEGLKACGVLWLFVSTDVNHLRFVPLENVLRGITIAEEVFGEDTTMGKTTRAELEETLAIASDEARREQYRRERTPMLVGRAKRVLSEYAEAKPLSELNLETGWGRDPDNTCCLDWDPLWEVHVDPYGNVQTNCGVILGNADETPVSEVVATWHERNPILADFAQRGVASLVDPAVERGFALAEHYPQKCYLCCELRGHLRNCDESYHKVFGPDEVYEE